MHILGDTRAGLVEYRLSGLASGQLAYLLRVPQDERGISLIDTLRGGGTVSWVDTGGTGARYYVCYEGSLLPAPALQRYQSGGSGPYALSELRNGRVCDYLIVYHREFL